MSVVVNAAPTQQAAKRDSSGSLGCSIIGIGAIVFGLWFGAIKTIEFAHGVLYDPDVAIEAEQEYLQRRMNCEPGEVWEIRPLGEHGAKSVRCVPGDNMPPVQQDRDAWGGTRG